MKKYSEYKNLNLTEVANEISDFWQRETIFQKSIESRSLGQDFVFYEGPPSANGLPGIHHVMARTLKDLFCRYQTMKGKKVLRKAGWDTHGLPVELGVEKELGITKEDIGKNISVAEYNQACREAVMRYTDVWNKLTEKMGYWVDMENPYITYKSKYIETVWWLLKQLHTKNLLYKGYTIQPYSPKAGTGLSSHELNMPGCYRDVKDTSMVAQFRLLSESHTKALSTFGVNTTHAPIDILAWTTTPWTLPSNTALTVGENIEYVLVESYNQYTFEKMTVVLAKALVGKQFSGKYFESESLEEFNSDDKKIPYRIIGQTLGKNLLDLRYEQLLPYCQSMNDADKAFRVIPGDFVTTEDGTGVVHTAPTFGADDARVAKAAGVPPMLIADENGNPVPLVDLQGKFVAQMGELGGKYVKNEYYNDGEAPEKSVDVEIAIQLKERGQAFAVEKYEHSYPHCWRTDKPILYYPLDSWFIRSTACKEQMIALNKEINWKPKATGEGRFGNWLENLNDWNLSRSRYWGIPLPIWRTEEGDESICIGSVEELKAECEKAVAAGFMKANPIAGFSPGNMDENNYEKVDLHRPYMDEIVLCSANGKAMKRESDLIDVWFDSGAMPYAQLHYPFENKELIDNNKAFPADFIAEGVDQTRGWFFTLHAIASMVFGKVAYKNVVSNGLVLDKNGQKMSKRLGNAIEPFKALEDNGADAIRWYMITNAQPWDNLKFDMEGVVEVQRKFFRALHNTYAFFALYANVDGFSYSEADIPLSKRPEIDRWIISRLNTLIKTVDDSYSNYEPTRAGRLIQDFVVDDLSNWHVRLSRKRFWRGDYGPDKISAYQTLYTCLTTVAKLSAPIAPFYSERLYRDLNLVCNKESSESVHLALIPVVNNSAIDSDLEERMALAQHISSMVLALRKKENIRVRQPLAKIMIPVLNANFKRQVADVNDLICNEVNIKEIAFLEDSTGVLVKRIKANFKTLGPKYGKQMKSIAQSIAAFNQEQIAALESSGEHTLFIDNQKVVISREDAEITTDDIPGWLVATENGITIALDISISNELLYEGLARELVNRIQNLRKEEGLQVTDRIEIEVQDAPLLPETMEHNKAYICSETLANKLELIKSLNGGTQIDLDEQTTTQIRITKV